MGKRSAALGSGALIAGATLAVFGVTATPAHATAQNVPYTCAVSVTYLNLLGLPVSESDEADMSLNIAGGVSGPVHVGDSVTLTGFQTLGNVSGPITNSPGYLLATSISGHYDQFPVVADLGGSQDPVSASMDISPSAPSDTGFKVQSPQAPMDLTGFKKPDQPGTMTFTPGSTVTGSFSVDMPTGTQQWPFTCHTGDASQITAVEVEAKPGPPSSPPPSEGSPPPSHGSPPPSHGSPPPGQQNVSAPAAVSNSSPSSDPSSSGSNATTGSPGDTRPRAQPQLANSGFSQALDLTIGGGALVLVGAGLMYAARRRTVTDPDT